MKYKHFLCTYREVLCQQYRLQLDCSHQALPADVALTAVYPYLKINLEQEQWEFKVWKLLSGWLGHFWFLWSFLVCMHVGFENCSFRKILHVGGRLSPARPASHITLVLSSCCLGALTEWAFFFLPWWSFLCEGGDAINLGWDEREWETPRAVIWHPLPTGQFVFLPTHSLQHFLFK